MEMHTVEDQAEAEAAKKASEETGVKIHSVMNAAHWRFPPSSSDPDVVEQERRRHGDVAEERGALGRRLGAAGARGRRREDAVSGCVERARRR